MNQNNILGKFCHEPTNDSSVNIAPSKITVFGVNNNGSTFSSGVNEKDSAFFESINVSHSQHCQSVTSESIKEKIASNLNKSNTKSTNKETEVNLSVSVRRSTRKKRKPLAGWKNQRCIYGTNEIGESIFLGIYDGLEEAKDIPSITTLQEIEEPLKKKPKYKGKKCSKIDHIVVLDKRNNSKVCANVLQSYKVLSWDAFSNSKSCDYQIAKTFDSKDISFGFLELFAFQIKPEQCSPEKNVHFCVFSGTVKVELNQNLFLAKQRDSFIVPCGNKYGITNMCQTKSVLLFCLFKEPVLNNLRFF